MRLLVGWLLVAVICVRECDSYLSISGYVPQARGESKHITQSLASTPFTGNTSLFLHPLSIITCSCLPTFYLLSLKDIIYFKSSLISTTLWLTTQILSACGLREISPLHAEYDKADNIIACGRNTDRSYFKYHRLSTSIASSPSARKPIIREKNPPIMYFSYSPSSPATSYTTAPMEIPSSSNTRSQQSSSSCAYPSWPRRSSLSSNSSSSSADEEAPASSYISDDDLFPCVFDDNEADCTPIHSPGAGRSPSASMSRMCEQQIVVDNGALMRELMAQHAREQAAKKEKKRRRSRKSSNGTTASKRMSPIPEAGE